MLRPLTPNDLQVHGPPIIQMEGGADAAREVKAIRLTYQAPAVLEVKGRPKYPCPFR